MAKALLLISHGTVDALDDLPAFLANIRRGHAPSPELVHEVRRRYEAIGGHSPLNRICGDVAAALGARLGVPARSAARLWAPSTIDQLAALATDAPGGDALDVAVVPLAQHSAWVYAEAARTAARELEARDGRPIRVACAENWGREPHLTRAFVAEVRRALAALPSDDARSRTTLILSAHSLPVAVVRGGDRYETEFRASAAGIVAELGADAPHHTVCFQSQGMSAGPGGRPVEWLGPDLRSALEAAKARGDTHVVVAPVGFLADHVEVLYDIDIEASGWARELGLTLSRTASLNASAGLLDAVEAVVRPLLASFTTAS